MALNKNKVIAAAQRYAQRGQFDRAISELRSIVEEDPEDVRVWHRIADLQIRKGSVSQAIATYTRIANFYAERGFFLKGVAVYKQILNADPTLVEAHRKLGELYIKLGLGPEAISQFQIVVGTCEREGRHQESLELLQKIVELGPEDESNRIRLAEAYARQGENDSAIDQFKQTLAHLREKRRLDEYSQVAERLLYLYPDELDVVRALSEIYLERNDAKRALARLQVLFRADPSDPGTLALLARSFSAIGQTAKAVSVYRELARIHAEAGDAAGQAEAWSRLLALDPEDLEALEATGNPPAGSVDVPAVSGTYNTGALNTPVGDRATRLLEDVDLLLKYSLKEHARERLDKVFEADPYHEGALLKLKELAAADERNDEVADALMRLADGAEQAGDAQKAMGWLGEVIQLRPGDPEAAERMRRVSSGMARQLAASVEPAAEAAVEYDAPSDYDVDLGELDFDASINDEPVGRGFDLDLGELDASVDDEFADLMSDEPIRPIASPASNIITPPPPDDAFGDLLADDPPPADDAFGDLLADEPLPADDAFGDLLADEPLPADDAFGDLLAGASVASPSEPDGMGDLLAEHAAGDAFEAPADEFGDLLGEVTPRPEQDFGDLLADEPPTPAAPAENDFGDLLADEPLATAAPDDDAFGDLLADEPLAPAASDDDAFGDLLGDAPLAPAAPVDEAAGGLGAEWHPSDATDEPGDAPAPAAEAGDFDDDGFGDLVLDDPPPAGFDAGDVDFGSIGAEHDDLENRSDVGFVRELPSQDELPDDDEFADLLLDHTGTEAEPDFGLYDSANSADLDLPDPIRLSGVSGAPSEIDIDIDVSMDMPDIDFAPLPVERAPSPAAHTELPPPPPPPRSALRPAVPPPPPPTPVEDDIDEIEELDLDEIMELDDDDLMLEDDSIDDSADGSSDDLDGSSDGGSLDDSSSSDGSSDDLRLDRPADESDEGLGAERSDDDVLDRGEGPADDFELDLGAEHADPDALNLGDPSTDHLDPGGSADVDASPPEAPDADDGAADGYGLDPEPQPIESDASGADVDRLDDPSLESAAADPTSATPSSAPDPVVDDSEADLDLGLAPPSDDSTTGAHDILDDGMSDLDREPDAESTPLGDAADDPWVDDAPAVDDAAASDTAEHGPSAVPDLGSADASSAGVEDSPPDPNPQGAEAPVEPRPGDTDAPAAVEHDAGGVAPDDTPAPTAEPATRPRPAPRPPSFDRAGSLRLGTGLPSAPKPMTASSLSLDARSMPTPPKPAGMPSPPARPDLGPRPATEQALLPPPSAAQPTEAESGDDTIAISASVISNMFDDGMGDPSIGDQTEAGGLSADSPEPLPEPVEPSTEGAGLEEELAELDFLIESGLLDDARELTRELRLAHPGHPGLAERAERLEAPSPFGDDDADDFLSGLTDGFDLDFDAVKGAELSDLGDDEADTHFDLGLAFREMGQYKKAIAELELAARRPDKRAEALRITALCHAEGGDTEQAASTLRDALDTPDLPLSARAGLQYDLASVYEQLGQPDQARTQLEGIVAAGMDDFLDVKARLESLQS